MRRRYRKLAAAAPAPGVSRWGIVIRTDPQGRSRAAFNMDGAIARLLFAVAFSQPGSGSFGIGVCAVVMAPARRAAGNRGRRFDPASRRGTCGLSWPARADVTGTGDGGHGRESWFAAMLDL